MSQRRGIGLWKNYLDGPIQASSMVLRIFRKSSGLIGVGLRAVACGLCPPATAFGRVELFSFLFLYAALEGPLFHGDVGVRV